MTNFKNINHIYIICDKDNEKDKYEKWINWIKFNNINDDYITFYCYKWGTNLTHEDLQQQDLSVFVDIIYNNFISKCKRNKLK